MSSNRMPGEGKSGNWRRAALSLILRRASSAAAEGPAAASLPWEALDSSVGSGCCGGGWAAVAGFSAGAGRSADEEVSGAMAEADEEEGPDMMEEGEGGRKEKAGAGRHGQGSSKAWVQCGVRISDAP